MKKRTALLGLTALVSLALSSGSDNLPSASQTKRTTDTALVSSLAPYTPPVSPRRTPQQGRFGLLTMIERDLDAIWTTEDRADGKYLIDLQLRFKDRRYDMMPDPFGRNSGLGQILHLQRRGTTRSYMIVGSNGNYFGSVDELLEGTVTFDLYDGDVPTLRRRVQTFEFVPNEQRRERKAY